MLKHISIELAISNLTFPYLIKDGIVVHLLRFRAWGDCYALDATTLNQHFPVTRICFVIQAIMLDTDNTVENAHFCVAVGSCADSALQR